MFVCSLVAMATAVSAGVRHVRGQPQVSQSTSLCLCRSQRTSGPLLRDTKQLFRGDKCLLAFWSRQVVPPSFKTFTTLHVKMTVIFPLELRHISLQWRQSSVLNFRQDVTLSGASSLILHPPHPTPPSPVRLSAHALVCRRGDGSF